MSDVMRVTGLDARLTNLPIPLTSFVGRTRELEIIKGLLESQRLVSLTGAGGCGKTRLALRIASELLVGNRFPNGVWWVDLASVSDALHVPRALARVLGIREAPERTPTDSVADYLASTRLFLVFDNCEHVIAASAQLSAVILRRCPDVHILTTTREPLRAAGEVVWPVPGLAMPTTGSAVPRDLQSLVSSDAVQLFAERAGAVLPHFVITEDNSAAVGEICRRLDGMPLAIELAAARAHVLSVTQILERLDRALSLLTRGSPFAPSRQQTLRATLDWSYDLLTGDQQTMLRQLAVFAGGFTLEAVEAVAGERQSNQAIDLLSDLVDKSLVVVERRSREGPRYRLLETIRQFAMGKLAEPGELTAARDRHTDWVLTLVERAEPELRGPSQMYWFDQLEIEHDNFVTSLEWCRQRDDVQRGLRLASALFWFWERRGSVSEGRSFLEDLLARLDASQAPHDHSLQVARAEALNGVGSLAWHQGDKAGSRQHLEMAEAAWRELGIEGERGLAETHIWLSRTRQSDYAAASRILDESIRQSRRIGYHWALAEGLAFQGMSTLQHGDPRAASPLIEESLALFRQVGDVGSVAMPLTFLGNLALERGALDSAQARFQQVLEAGHATRTNLTIALALNNLGEIARCREDYTQARLYYESSQAYYHALGHTRDEARLIHNFAWIALREGSIEEATQLFRESLTRFQRLEHPRGIIECIAGFGGVAAAEENEQAAMRAVRLFGSAQALRNAHHLNVWPADRIAYEASLAATRLKLTHEQFESAWNKGQAMSLEPAIEYALSEADVDESWIAKPPTPPDSLTPRQLARQQYGGLTAREREVAALVVQGKSNREIAQELVVSERTVDKHVSSILAKLDFHSRAQIAAWAIEVGLAKRSA